MQSTSFKGFTLIELSVVLVIIGLLIGGVVVGQDLIRAGEIRATVAQVEQYNSAVNAFRSKYGGLPGDISTGGQFGLVPRGNDFLSDNIANGDGNGMIEGCWYPGSQMYGCETALFWKDLGDTGLIKTSFPTITDNSGNPTVITPGNVASALPAAKLGRGNYFAVFTGGENGSYGPAGLTGTNYYFLGVITQMSDDYYTDAGLTPAEAYAMDSKMDDGLPSSGSVRTLMNFMPNHNFSPGQPGASNCGLAASYNTSNPAVLCTLMLPVN